MRKVKGVNKQRKKYESEIGVVNYRRKSLFSKMSINT